MEQFSGKLLRDSQVVADNISGRLDVYYYPNNEQRWSGYFSLPAGFNVQLNEEFVLVLDTLRSSKIKIVRVNTTNQGLFVSFENFVKG